MDNLKEALEYAVELAKPETYEIEGETYASQKLFRVEGKEIKLVSPLKITTLTSFIDYIQTNRDNLDFKDTIVQITGTASVRLISIPNRDMVRQTYVEAAACLPEISYGHFYDRESFNILLQSSFEENNHREILIKYISHIKEDEGIAVADDGVGQRVVAQTGITSVDNVILPNPVFMKPYRTFQELEQPESKFVFRVQKGPRCALFEADGGAWKIKCRSIIKTALTEKLANIDDIVIIG